MTYRAPVEDFSFVFEHIAGLPELLKLQAFSGLEPDLIEAVLQENAKFTSEVVAPTNWDGDQHPPVYANGVVTMPGSYQRAFKQFVEGGWQGLRHPEQWGGPSRTMGWPRPAQTVGLCSYRKFKRGQFGVFVMPLANGWCD